MESCLFSVIVPIYNSSNTLDMCIMSLLEQTYSNLEILLIDDGSFDSSKDICMNYVSKDSRVKYFYKENGGLSDARNYGLDRISGDYVLFLDSDDCFDCSCIETMHHIIEMFTPDIISFNFTYDLTDFEKNVMYNVDEKYFIEHGVLQEYFKKEVAVTNRCFRANLVDNIRFIKGQISEDVIYLFKCYEKAQSLYKTDCKYYFYNQSGESITRSGLSIKDNTSVEANEYVVDVCRSSHSDLFEYSIMQYCKSIFNLINKSVLRGFKDDESKRFYKDKFKTYKRLLRRNYIKILKSSQISKNDKLQISILVLSINMFKIIKKILVR